LGRADPEVLEYPNYATAYALRCLVRARRPQDRDLMKRMVAYLAAQQYGPARGFSEQSPAFGGWGFGGDYPPGETGHMDLAHTRHVLQALREAGEVEPAVFTRAQQFLRFVQQHPDDPRPQLTADGSPAGSKIAPYDGGFYFSPMVLGANKGRTGTDAEGNTYFRSYATASCDGLLALLAAGVPRDDERVAAAARWLAKHPRLDYPEGVPRDLPEPWGESIHFYHLAVRSEVYRRLRWPGAWRTEIVRLLDGQQDRCGRFVNRRCHLMKEDDPLLCTTLAVIALSHGS
jgi:squalene-hopene/tetraprenyl-beta-curcumene cyclase